MTTKDPLDCHCLGEITSESGGPMSIDVTDVVSIQAGISQGIRHGVRRAAPILRR